jgi:hypothetical protein
MFRTRVAPTWSALLVSCAIAACGGGNKANRPPSISAVSIAPSSPRVTDELTAQATISDPDGDEPTVTYRWTRDGSPISGQTGRTLPRGNHAKGQVIEVFITANDGRAEANGSGSATIQDSPAQLTASPPTQVAYGEEFAFDIVATDADNDPIDLSLLHGPVGMAVSSTGRVTWTARLPLFEQTLDVNWAIAASADAMPALSGVVRVEDPARRYPLHRTANNHAFQRELIVANLDGSGTPEILAFGGTLYELGYEAGTFVQRWAHPFHMEGALPGARVPGGSAPLAVGDVDGDGRMEIFAGLRGAVMKLDGGTRRRAAGFDLPATCLDLFVADLTNDGSLEVICLAVDAGGAKRIRTFHASSGASIAQTATMNATEALAVGNVDGDSALEIVTSDGLVIDIVGLAAEWSSGVSFGRDLTLGDVDGDGIAEIVGIVAGAVQAFDAVDRALQWNVAPLTGSRDGASAIIAADLNADGAAEIIVNDSSQTKGYRLNSVTGQRELAFELDTLFSSARDYAYGVGDLDGDDDLDLVKSYSFQTGLDRFEAGMLVASLDATAQRIWHNSTPNTLLDVTGGFWAELIAGQRRLVFAWDGLLTVDPLAERYARSVNPGGANPGDTSQALGVFDVDADGIDDAFLGRHALAQRYHAASDTLESFGASLGGGTARAIVHGDVNMDGFEDFVAMTPFFGVRVFDVQHATMLLEGATTSRGIDIEVADLNRDGSLEIVGLYENSVVVYDDKLQWRAATAIISEDARRPADLLVTDSSGDGVAEIFVLSDQPSGARTITQFSADLRVVAQFDMPNVPDLPTVDFPDVWHIFAEELGPGRKNLIIAGRDGDVQVLRAIDPRTGALVWRSPALNRTASRNSLHYVDTNADGEPEIAFGSSLGFYVTR